MSETRLAGGTEADRRRLLERRHEYLEANAGFDWRKLQDSWSAVPRLIAAPVLDFLGPEPECDIETLGRRWV